MLFVGGKVSPLEIHARGFIKTWRVNQEHVSLDKQKKVHPVQ